MDSRHFDALTRRLYSRTPRRRVVALLTALPVLGGLGAILAPDAAGKGKGNLRAAKRKGRGKRHAATRATAEAEPCWRAGACIPGTGSNVSRCDLAGSTAFHNLDCTGCNASRANLRGIDARNANFTRANLSGSCLVDADLTGATFASTTNLSAAVFCRTTMPNGSINNSGCGSGTACCATTCVPTSCQALGKTCGAWPDGCGGTLQCGTCGTGATPSCNAGICAACAAACTCGACANLTDGSTQCVGSAGWDCIDTCATNADCAAGKVCVGSTTSKNTNQTESAAELCHQTSPGICQTLRPCVPR